MGGYENDNEKAVHKLFDKMLSFVVITIAS